MILVILLVIFLLSFLYDRSTIEGLDTFNGRMMIDDQYFYDKVFDDVSYYPNEYDEDKVYPGVYRCTMECPGNCVEYGVSGNAYCFPY